MLVLISDRWRGAWFAAARAAIVAVTTQGALAVVRQTEKTYERRAIAREKASEGVKKSEDKKDEKDPK